MKELSIEEKAKAYDKVREKIAIRFGSNVAEEIFSEYEENEDERIRKEIIYHIQNCDDTIDEETGKRMLAWLEKQGEITKEWSEMKFNNIRTELQEMADLKQKTEQGEQNPAWSKEDKNMERFIGNAIMFDVAVEYLKEHNITTIDAHEWLKSLKDRVQPKQEWSEEDESYLNTTIAYLKDAKEFKKTAENCIDWLKSIRLKNRWKPTEKQIKALHDLSITGNISYAGQGQTLIELYNDLKKL